MPWLDTIGAMWALIHVEIGAPPYLLELPSGDYRCPVCGLINPDVPEGPVEARCDYCVAFIEEYL